MSREEDESVDETAQLPRFAVILNRLFVTRLKKDASGYERPFTLREVAQQTGISIGWLSEARRGNIENPSADKIELLATFFGVKPGYFFGEPGKPDPERGSPALRRAMEEALEEPLLRQIVLRAGELSAVERSMVLEILNRVQKLGQWGTDQSIERARERDQRGKSGETSKDS